MTHFPFSALIACLLVGATLNAQPDNNPNQEKPNFVVIFADDLGYGDLGCYGHPTIRTPHLDRMASEGMRFTQFYSAAVVCTPSRAAILTGRLPIRNGMVGHKRRNVLKPHSKGHLPDEEITIAEALKEKGYATMALGKWHLGHHPEGLPLRHGFDEYFGAPYSNDMKPYYYIDGEEALSEPMDQSVLTKRLTERAVDFIRRKKDEPFFLYFAHPFPHTPLFASERFRDQSPRGLYGDVVEELDWSVGQVLDTLRNQGLDQNTLVFFTSDNGPWLRELDHGGSAGLLRDGKGSTFEGGMRVPAIGWWPGRIGSGRTSTTLSSTMDLFATFVGLAGGSVPTDRIMDTHDLRPVLFGRGPGSRKTTFFYRGKVIMAVRHGPWKAHFFTQAAYEKRMPLVQHTTPLLYQLEHDASEMYDLSGDHKDVIEAIKKIRDAHEKAFTPPPSQIEI